MKRKNDFTLIELLVVIAIITILAGMLLPALGQVKKAASKTVCLNNQKTIATAHRYYMEDFNDYLPTYNIWDNGTRAWNPFVFFSSDSWGKEDTTNVLFSYYILKLKTSAVRSQAQKAYVNSCLCPQRAPNPPHGTWGGAWACYGTGGLNGQLVKDEYNKKKTITGSVRKPSITLMTGEALTSYDFQAYFSNAALCKEMADRHLKSMSVIFVDGHGESRSMTQMPMINNFYCTLPGHDSGILTTTTWFHCGEPSGNPSY